MPFKTLLFLGVFGMCCLGTLFVSPLWGVLGYVGHYCMPPEGQWWAAGIKSWGIRYSFVLALLTGVGILFHYRRLRYGKRLFHRHEVLAVLFLGIVWLSVLIGEPTHGRYATIDHPSVKLTKVIIFALMMTHVVTTRRRLEALIWVLVIGALVLGWQAYKTPPRDFVSGRLESVGGPDFRESNVLAAYLAGILPLIGVQFLRSGWLGKGLCLLSGVMATNAIVLTRSRSAVVGLALGAVAAIVMAPKRIRGIVIVSVIAASIGMYALTDPQFIVRAGTITRGEEDRDASSESRLEIWKGSFKMFADNPFGVGAGNFHQSIGRYAPGFSGSDAHNTFVRCFGELGVPGFILFMMLITNPVVSLWRIIRKRPDLPEAQGMQVTYIGYGLLICLVVILGCGLTVTMFYVEALWWLLAMPTCIVRLVENLEADVRAAAGPAKAADPSRATVPRAPALRQRQPT
jgi:O-antigen ligase